MKNTKALRLLHTLWGQYSPAEDAAESRADRLAYLSRVVGRPVASAKELSAEELRAASNRLLHDLTSTALASQRQVWKIRQIERYLGWNRQRIRLETFLWKMYRARRPEDLSARNAWRSIEALVRIAARALAKDEGSGTPAEVREWTRRVKQQLESWRPEEVQSS